MIDPHHFHVIGDQLSVVTDAQLRHDEKGNPLQAGRPALDLRQHQVDDVLDAVVVGRRNEYLLPPDQVVSLVGGHGGRGDVAQRASGLGLREGHGPLPFSRKEPRDIGLLLFGRPEGFDQVGRAHVETRVAAGRIVGRAEDKRREEPHRDGKLLSSQVSGGDRRNPSSLAALPHQLPDGRMHFHVPVFETGRVLVHLFEARAQEIISDFHRGVDNHIEHLRRVLGVSRILEDRRRVEDVIQ